MKKIIIIALTCLFILGCEQKIKPYKENYLDKITMKILENTLTKEGTSILITDFSNINNVYGSYFKIQRKKENRWEDLNPLINNFGFNYYWL